MYKSRKTLKLCKPNSLSISTASTFKSSVKMDDEHAHCLIRLMLKTTTSAITQ